MIVNVVKAARRQERQTILQRHEAILQEEIEKHGKKPKTYRKAHERLLEELEQEVDES